MCGIVGIIAKTDQGKSQLSSTKLAVAQLSKRGPDYQAVKSFENAALGHARLSVIDTSEGASQPFTSADQRYTIVFNGEIYNYRELRVELEQDGIHFITQSDTEVLLYWLIKYGAEGINSLNGFFSFCFFDSERGTFLIARDRFGIKPLLLYEDEHQIIFASEMKAILTYAVNHELNADAITLYLKFNYQPSDLSVLANTRKVKSGSYLFIQDQRISEEKQFYQLPFTAGKYSSDSYEIAQKKVKKLLYESVERRLVADVPLGTFLSGGIDSSIITAIASELKPNLHTYSVGFKDEPLFDETHYAELVAKKFKTNHTVFKLSNDDLYAELETFLDYNCEPFADSSALAVNVLCKHTRKDLTVALSGDGADELFSGYNKHMAEFLARENSLKNTLIKAGSALWNNLPQSRNSKVGNLGRQLSKFSKGLKQSPSERYWNWAGLMEDRSIEKLYPNHGDLVKLRKGLVGDLECSKDFNEVLLQDFKQVLSGDMLFKVDAFSMANSLEVRVPFLDHHLVEYVFSLPVDYKIIRGQKKRILQDAFRELLPPELYKRPKHGFEVPLLKWFTGPLWEKINGQYLNRDFIESQGLFSYSEVQSLFLKLKSASPGDSVANIWALVVFQHWYMKYFQR